VQTYIAREFSFLTPLDFSISAKGQKVAGS